MSVLETLYVNLLPSLGFILALVFMAHLLRQRRSPTSTLAWLMALVFIPYVGVPLYLLFGGRKMQRKAAAKSRLLPAEPVHAADPGLAGQLASLVYRGGFPPTRCNHVKLLLTGEEAYAETLRLIQRASYTINVATYILGRGETGRTIVAALTRKAAQGVKVCLLLDALGSFKIDRRFLAPLHRAGGRSAFFMPMLRLPFQGRANLRNHRKMLICDDRSAIVGGMNLAHEYMGPQPAADRWDDISLSIAGPAAAQAFEIFRSDWQFAAGETLELRRPARPQTDGTATTALQFMASGPDVENDALREALIMSLFRAHQRVWIVTPYFVPDELLEDALCMAARRGIDLRLITPARSNHRLADMVREGYIPQLQAAGAKVLLYQPRMLHAKALLIDDTVAVLGSANMDMRSLLLNYEVGLCIYSPEVIRQVEAWMRFLMAESLPRTPPQGNGLKLLEGMARIFAPLI